MVAQIGVIYLVVCLLVIQIYIYKKNLKGRDTKRQGEKEVKQRGQERHERGRDKERER